MAERKSTHHGLSGSTPEDVTPASTRTPRDRRGGIRADRRPGVTDYTFTLTAHAKARRWDAAFGAGVVRVQEGQSGRGERRQTTLRHLDVPASLQLEIEVTGTARWLTSSIA